MKKILLIILLLISHISRADYTIAQYQKNIGRGVKVKLIEGSGKIEGTMISATEEQITVQTTRKERVEGKKKKETIVEDHVILMADIRQTKLVLSFK